jgi:hypothetical protein
MPSDPNTQCARNADGTLKEASEINFFHDVDDANPIQAPKDAFSVLLQAGHKPSPLIAGSRRSTHTSKPSARLRDTDNAYSSSSAQKRALSASSPSTEQPASKKIASHDASPLDSNDDFEHSDAMTEPLESPENDLVPSVVDLDDESLADDTDKIVSVFSVFVDLH